MTARTTVRLTAVAAAALLALGLTACDVKVGQAAVVGDQKIRETTVASYVEPNAPTSTQGSIGPKAFVVQELVKKIVLGELAKTIGGVPSDADLASLHDAALSQVFQAQVEGAAADKELRTQAAAKGLKANFDALYIHNIEVSTALGEYLRSASAADQAKLQKAVENIKVRVNPRYGKWSDQQLTIDGSAMPSWLKVAKG